MKIFKLFIILIIISFLALFFAYKNGYYEKTLQKEVLLTNEKIEQFEKDLQSGKDISLETYQEEEKDYTTKTSKMSLKVSSKLENIISSSIKFIFRKLGSAIE